MLQFRFKLSAWWPVYVTGALILSLSLVTVIGERGALHLWRLRGEKASLDEQNYRLQKENEALRRRVQRLRTDDDYLEKVAREELNLVRPGEIVYRFPSRTNREPAPSTNGPASQPRRAAEQKERR